MTGTVEQAVAWAVQRDEQLRIERGMDRGERMAVIIREARILYHDPDAWIAIHDALNPEVVQMRRRRDRVEENA